MQRRPLWRAAAAIALALLAGAAGGWLLGARPPTGIAALAQEAGVSYAVYAADRQHPVELAATERHIMAAWFSDRLNRPVTPPNLTAVGYRLLGGRLVATRHGPAALFGYEKERGTRLIVYGRPMKKVKTTPIELIDIGDVEDLDACAWIERGVGYTVVAAEPYERLLELSKHVRQQAQPTS